MVWHEEVTSGAVFSVGVDILIAKIIYMLRETLKEREKNQPDTEKVLVL